MLQEETQELVKTCSKQGGERGVISDITTYIGEERERGGIKKNCVKNYIGIGGRVKVGGVVITSGR